MMSSNQCSDQSHHRKRLRLDAVDYADPTYVFFVTLCARHLSSPFSNSELACAVVDALLFQRRSGQLKLYAFVLMPDHLHAAVSPAAKGRSISEVLRSFKSYTTRLA